MVVAYIQVPNCLRKKVVGWEGTPNFAGHELANAFASKIILSYNRYSSGDWTGPVHPYFVKTQ